MRTKVSHFKNKHMADWEVRPLGEWLKDENYDRLPPWAKRNVLSMAKNVLAYNKKPLPLSPNTNTMTDMMRVTAYKVVGSDTIEVEWNAGDFREKFVVSDHLHFLEGEAIDDWKVVYIADVKEVDAGTGMFEATVELEGAVDSWPFKMTVSLPVSPF